MEEKKTVKKQVSPKTSTKKVTKTESKKTPVKKVAKKVTKTEVKKAPVKSVAKKEAPAIESKTVLTNVGPRRKEFYSIGLLSQAVLTTFALLLLIGGLFDEFFLNIFDAVVSLLLFVTAYNNNTVFKRKHLTTIYVLAGILFAGMFITRLFS
jgi:cation transport ATPase